MISPRQNSIAFRPEHSYVRFGTVAHVFASELFPACMGQPRACGCHKGYVSACAAQNISGRKCSYDYGASRENCRSSVTDSFF